MTITTDGVGLQVKPESALTTEIRDGIIQDRTTLMIELLETRRLPAGATFLWEMEGRKETELDAYIDGVLLFKLLLDRYERLTREGI